MIMHLKTAILLLMALIVLRSDNACPSNCSCNRDRYHCCLSSDNVCSVVTNLTPDRGMKRCETMIKSLTVEINGDTWPGERSFGSCLNLRKLTITGNNRGKEHILELNSKDINVILDNMNETYKRNLVTFSLLNSRFKTIQSGFMHRLEFLNIENIIINANQDLSELSTGCFLGLNRLKTLDLRNNSLKDVSLTKWGISSGSELVSLDLSFNQITQLNRDTFESIKNVEEIYLDNNLLSGLDASVFNELINLRVLSLKGNNLVLSSLTGLLSDPGPRFLHLSNNPLLESSAEWWITKGCPANTEVIKLSNIALDFDKLLMNNETRIMDITQCPSLRLIEFEDNTNLRCLPKNWLNYPERSLIQILPKSLDFCPSLTTEMEIPPLTSESNSGLNASEIKDIFEFSEESFGRSMILVVMLSLFILVVFLTLFASFFTCYKRHKQQAILKTQPYCGNNENYTLQHNFLEYGMNHIGSNNTASYVYCPSIEGSQHMLNTLPKSPILYFPNSFNKDPDSDSLNCNDSGISNSGKPSNTSSKQEGSVIGSPKFIPVKMVNGPNYQNVYYHTCSSQRKVFDANLSSSLMSLSNPYRSQSPSANSLMLVANRNAKELFNNGTNSPMAYPPNSTITSMHRKFQVDEVGRLKSYQTYTAQNGCHGEENPMAYSNVFASNVDHL